MANKNNLLLLFDRPNEPVFMEKGDLNSRFEVPSSLLSDRYKGNPEIQERFGENSGERIPVRANIAIPNLKVPMSLDRKEQFSLFIPRHRSIAAHLINIFMGLRSIDDLQTVAVYARDRVNPILFNYALSVALLHRPDTKDLNLPLFVETFPEKYVDSKVFREIREEASVVPEGQRMPITVPKDYTAS
ncbi:phenoloxidase 2-like, partial [Contarinia nasturtii]|uniref:phenoloxidase 2-like n=1 Tax=Contarinia nasturtii TaxID=265458 RepID=UPI0012D464B0